MKKAKIEDLNLPDVELWVENTPDRNAKTVNLFSYGEFGILAKSWTNQMDRLIITIDEGNGALSLFIAKSKFGNGYVKRGLESGKHVVGRVFDIVSPIYFIENPIRGTTFKSLVTYSLTSDIRRCLFFPTPVTNLQVFYNFTTSPGWFGSAYGKSFGVAGKSLFFETTSFQPDPNISGLTDMSANNNDNANGEIKRPYIGGDYRIL